MINKAASSSGFTRKYDYKRHKLTIGYTLFFAFVLIGITFAVARFMAKDAGSLPLFIKTSVFGQLYLYNIVAFFTVAVAIIVNPKMFICDDIPTNRWNLYFKSGILATKLITNKILFCVCSILRIFAVGAAGVFLLGFLTKSGETSTGIIQWIMSFVLGICLMLIIVMPAVFFGTFIFNRFILSAIELVFLIGAGFLLFSSGYISPSDEISAVQSLNQLVMPSPTSASIIGVAFLILFWVGASLIASAKIKLYEVEELNDTVLMQLGITRDIVIYERNEDDFEVAISGPDIFDAEGDSSELDFDRSPYSGEDGENDERSNKKKKDKKTKKEKKKKVRRDDEDDEDDEDD